MDLKFLGDAGIYIPAEDGVKFTGISDGVVVEYIATRAAIIAAGAKPTMDPESLLRFFEAHRGRFEAAAANVDRTASLMQLIGPAEINRTRRDAWNLSSKIKPDR
jgi:hypothetical protein